MVENVIEFKPKPIPQLKGFRRVSETEQLIAAFTNIAENPPDDPRQRIFELVSSLGWLRNVSEETRDAVVDALIDREDVQERLAEIVADPVGSWE